MPSEAERAITAELAGVVVAIPCRPQQRVEAGTPLLVLESMKMEHEVLAGSAGVVRSVVVTVGEAVEQGQLLLRFEPSDDGLAGGERTASADDQAGGERTASADDQAGGERAAPTDDHAGGERAAPAEDEASGEDQAVGASAAAGLAAGAPAAPPRADLAAVRERHAVGLDEARPEAVARRRERGQRTARENLAELLDAGSFVEYGPLLFAAQERRRAREELIARTPADGLVGGVGRIEGRACVAMSYDYTVLAGTQGMRNHAKKDRLFELAERRRLPVVLLAEGGGGRPGDVDAPVVAGLDCRAFELFAQLSGLVPLVGIASGYCFAGNAALLGCCDVVIATENSSIGMGGPAMIEGGGLGVHDPAEVGPIEMQHANGVVDLRVADEHEAVLAARRYLSYLGGARDPRPAPAEANLSELIPEQRKRPYDVRRVVRALFDEGSVLELRRGFAAGMLTLLARVDGRPLGVVANNAQHLGGAIDADGADKAARFLQLCDAFALPVLFLCDTPGFMVGPDAERTATVRHFARMFLTGANLSVPTGTIVLRKGYGLGAQAMAGGGFKAPLFTIAWPTAEFGAMGLEGAVRLGMRRELEAIGDEREREQAFEQMVSAAYERGRGLNMAAYGEIDDVIDPADSRRWIATLLDDAPGEWWRRPGKRRPNIDAW